MTFYEGKRVAVAGASGFVGSHFSQALLCSGAKVRALVHRRPFPFSSGSYALVQADLTRPEDARRALDGVEILIHAAGSVAGAAATTSHNPVSLVANQLALTATLVEAAGAVGVERLLLFSSSSGYPQFTHPVTEAEFWLGDPPEVYHGYAWMRRYFEKLGEFVHRQSSTRVALARPTAVYGPRDNFNPHTSHVIAGLIRRSLAGENPLVVWGTGEETRDLLFVEDLVEGCLRLLAHHACADPVNIGAGKSVTIREAAHLILELSGRSPHDLVFDPTKPTTLPYRAVNCDKARELLDFYPAVSLREGLRQTISWYQQNTPD
jgi:GDP-L-fucose synthase